MDADDGRPSLPLWRQLYDRLRSDVLEGRLVPGSRLPASRTLALELGVSRNTVVNAFDQLISDGYLESRRGSGTFVARFRNDDLGREPEQPLTVEAGPRRLSSRGNRIATAYPPYRPAELRPFQTGVPAAEAFEGAIWRRLADRYWGPRPKLQLRAYQDPAGHGPLRRAIMERLAVSRAIACRPENVIVVSGSQQAFDLASRVLLDHGDAAWVEDPGYPGVRGALTAAEASIVPVPVDGEGLDVSAGTAAHADARLVYVTPSHQFPLGVTMSLRRRLALLGWARASGGFILEDDYGSEYRYVGRQLEALHSLDGEGRVIYVGTFSKVLFPALRLGYLVVPDAMIDAFAAARTVADRHSPLIEQAMLADYMVEGHFARRVKRMRQLYAERQAVLVRAARKCLKGLLEVNPSPAGLHLLGLLPADQDDRLASRAAAEHGVRAAALSDYSISTRTPPGLLLGYTGFTNDEIVGAVDNLAIALREVRQGRTAGR
jgi:GntR family transcriptional regulator/MocR family aminotransferase